MNWKTAVFAIVSFCLVALFAFAVWPTPYRYFSSPNGRVVRVDRFTQTAEVLSDTGWMRLTGPDPFAAIGDVRSSPTP
jgi:hypothetical protein